MRPCYIYIQLYIYDDWKGRYMKNSAASTSNVFNIVIQHAGCFTLSGRPNHPFKGQTKNMNDSCGSLHFRKWPCFKMSCTSCAPRPFGRHWICFRHYATTSNLFFFLLFINVVLFFPLLYPARLNAGFPKTQVHDSTGDSSRQVYKSGLTCSTLFPYDSCLVCLSLGWCFTVIARGFALPIPRPHLHFPIERNQHWKASSPATSSGPLLANPDLFICKFALWKWILCGRFST